MKEANNMLDECLRALNKVGCTLEERAGYWDIIFPDGEEVAFPDAQFKLICYRVYNEVQA